MGLFKGIFLSYTLYQYLEDEHCWIELSLFSCYVHGDMFDRVRYAAIHVKAEWVSKFSGTISVSMIRDCFNGFQNGNLFHSDTPE